MVSIVFLSYFPMADVFIRLTAATDVGRVRTNNEDNFILNKNLSQQQDWFLPEKESKPIQLCPEGCVLAVADGMGGLNAGEVASDIAITTVKEMFSTSSLDKLSKNDKTIEKFMRRCVASSDVDIKQRVKDDPETSGMGTTLIFSWILGNKAHVVWCGDSRGYVFNPESGLRRITKDHSYVQQLIDEGKLDPKLAFDHPDSNIITRCLGDFNGKAEPDYCSVDLVPGDHVLLCSDGLCGLCRDEEIQQVFRENFGDLEQCKNELIKHAMDAGGYDNCTLAICEIVSIDGKTCNKTPEAKKILSSTLNEYVSISSDNKSQTEKTDSTTASKNTKQSSDSSVDSDNEDIKGDENITGENKGVDNDSDAENKSNDDTLKKLTVFPYDATKKRVSVPRGLIIFFVLIFIAAVLLLVMQYFGLNIK